MAFLPSLNSSLDQGELIASVGFVLLFLYVVLTLLCLFLRLLLRNVRDTMNVRGSGNVELIRSPVQSQRQNEVVDESRLQGIPVRIYPDKSSMVVLQIDAPDLPAAPAAAAEEKMKDEEEESCCSICLDVYMAGDEVRVLPQCKHMYHKGCIDPWLISFSGAMKCPLCRRKAVMMPRNDQEAVREGEGQVRGGC